MNFLAQKNRQAPGDEVAKKLLRAGTGSLTTSHLSDRKSASLLLKTRDIFFTLKHLERQNKKAECWEQDKVLGEALL